MNNEKHIFVDLDGVLCDFQSRVCELFNVNYENVLVNWPRGEYSMYKILGLENEDQMWERIDASLHFWDDIPACPEAEAVWDICNHYGVPVTIATSPSRHPSSSYGKVAWMRKWRGPKFRDYVITPRKFLLAGSGRVLIDDWDKNVKNWLQHGGNPILFPRIWNSHHEYRAWPLHYTKGFLDHYILGEGGAPAVGGGSSRFTRPSVDAVLPSSPASEGGTQ